MEAIKRDFGSFDQMKEKLNAASVGVQGSGWGWLVSELFLTSLSKNRNNMPLENPGGFVFGTNKEYIILWYYGRLIFFGCVSYVKRISLFTIIPFSSNMTKFSLSFESLVARHLFEG